MKGTIRIDHISKNIIASAAFIKASANITTEEYKTLKEIMMIHPTYSLVKREIRKNPQKESYRGLTYEYMQNYIASHDNAEKRLAIYNELRIRAKCHSIRYAHIKKWFLETYPEIDDFDCKITKGVVALPLAS